MTEERVRFRVEDLWKNAKACDVCAMIERLLMRSSLSEKGLTVSICHRCMPPPPAPEYIATELRSRAPEDRQVREQQVLVPRCKRTCHLQ